MFSSITASLLKRSHKQEPEKWELYTLLRWKMAFGWQKENSWMISLFLLMYSALFILISFSRPSILFSMKFPRCFAPSTHGRGFLQRSRGCTNLSFCRNFKHFVLDFVGFLSVLNFILWSAVYSSQTLACSEENFWKEQSGDCHRYNQGCPCSGHWPRSQTFLSLIYLNRSFQCNQ